ncbi:MAG: hypothetical protein LBV27_07495 [Oscillospiraceae bacterium]|jgi:hypothetical protein|nr:hypothetical protein [Oscillospiraceae bacterium]
MDSRKIERVLGATTLEGSYRARVVALLALKRRAAARQLSYRARRTGKRSLLQCGRFATRAGLLFPIWVDFIDNFCYIFTIDYF